ncbi:MAG TPA: hypothetical protein ENN19_16010 [Chloroflexi bacterium]|nr:hypothetical protein [Chloroflexota bacterium]
MKDRRRDAFSFDWGFLLQWMVVTTVGWVLGALLIPPIGLAASGIFISVLQWVTLQHQIGKSGRWILAGAGGWMTGWAIAMLVVPWDSRLLAGLVLGTTVGVAQWLVLRREVQWAGWWIIVSPLAWATGLGLLPGFILSGVMPGVMTGIVLTILLQYPQATSTSLRP